MHAWRVQARPARPISNRDTTSATIPQCAGHGACWGRRHAGHGRHGHGPPPPAATERDGPPSPPFSFSPLSEGERPLFFSSPLSGGGSPFFSSPLSGGEAGRGVERKRLAPPSLRHSRLLPRHSRESGNPYPPRRTMHTRRVQAHPARHISNRDTMPGMGGMGMDPRRRSRRNRRPSFHQDKSRDRRRVATNF